MDTWRVALAKCHLSEAVMPTSRGYLIENVDAYNRIQAILDTPEMEHCHKFLYNLDIEDLQEDEIEKIDKLYKLGQDRGFIQPDEPERDDIPDDAVQGADLSEPDCVDAKPPIVPPAIPAPAPRTACYTVMYSAMRNGEVKTGEAYSNSISPRAAKADVLAQLSRIGYDNITILAIEATDPDCVDAPAATGMDVPFVPPAKTVPEIGQVGTAFEDDEKVDEDDMLKGKKHNLHVDEAGEDDQDDSGSDDASKDSDDSGDDEAGDDTDGDDSEEENSEEKGNEDSEDQDDGDEEVDNEESSDDGEELDDSKKSALKDKYKKAFRAAMLKCKFEDKSFDDLTLKEKVDFFTEMAKSWSDDNDPSKFMTSKEIESLNKTVIKR